MLGLIDQRGIGHDGSIPESAGLVHWYDTERSVSRWLIGKEVVYKMDDTLTRLRQSVERSVFVPNDAHWAFCQSLPIFVEETGYRSSGTMGSHAFR
ncbi:MAG: hypothetical protein UHS51_01540 [Atopobiaceae bacterium]|nr:hypothetical protein [Atopobiaceae bacterium]